MDSRTPAGCSHETEAPQQSGSAPPSEGVFPDAEHMPAVSSQETADLTVTRLVAVDLESPESGVLTGPDAMQRATVPETAIDKDGQAQLGKHEVRFAGQRVMSAPAADVGFSENMDQAQFRGAVAVAAHLGHESGTFGGSEVVGHEAIPMIRALAVDRRAYPRESLAKSAALSRIAGWLPKWSLTRATITWRSA